MGKKAKDIFVVSLVVTIFLSITLPIRFLVDVLKANVQSQKELGDGLKWKGCKYVI